METNYKKKQKFKKAVLTRLKSVVKHWYEASENYHNLEEFLIDINVTIQDIRNITFLLQKNGNLYADFDVWYGKGKKNGGKRKEMREDEALVWIVDARNKIVKEGDLELFSLAFVSIENWKKIPFSPKRVSPMLSNELIAQMFSENFQTDVGQVFIEKMGAPLLKISRIWVEKNYNDYEILSILSYAYCYLKNLIIEFSGLAGIEWGKGCLDFEGDDAIKSQILPEKSRVCYWNLENHSNLNIQKKAIKRESKAIKEAQKRYNLQGAIPEGAFMKKCPFEDINVYINMAKSIVKTGDQHVPMIFFYGNNGLIRQETMIINNRTEKYAMMKRLGETLKLDSKITAIVSINEVWLLDIRHKSDLKNVKKHYKKPSLKTAKKEAIDVRAFNNKGEYATLQAPYIRVGNKIIFEKTQSIDDIEMDIFSSVKDAWNIKTWISRNPKLSKIIL